MSEALRLRQACGGRFLAGGTDVFPALGDGATKGDFIDLTACVDLKRIETTDTHLRIGAAATWAEIARADLPTGLAGLQAAAREVGSVQIQNRATVGGNLCNASPAADGVPPLLALDAEVELLSPAGLRRLPLGEFVLGNRRTALAPDEILAAVLVPATMTCARSAFRKLGARKYMVISIVMAGVNLVVANEEIVVARVAVGAASAAARRIASIERRLVGMPPRGLTRRNFLAKGDFEDLSPIDDSRATAAYRLDAAHELVARTVLDAWEAQNA